MTKAIPYYRVKGGRAYWQPTQKMQSMGFLPRALGPDNDESRQEAAVLNGLWKEQRTAIYPRRGTKLTAKERCGYIYFMFAESMVKIGFSTTPTARASHLQTAMPVQLSSVVIFAGERKTEKKLHAVFARHHSHREWFRAAEPIRRLVMRSLSFGKIMLENDEKLEQTRTFSNSGRQAQLESLD